MNKFEGGAPILEKGPEQKKETDPVINKEQELLDELVKDLEAVAQDLERVFAENPDLALKARKEAVTLKYREDLESGKLSQGNRMFAGPWEEFWAQRALKDAAAPGNIKVTAEKILKIRKTKKTKPQKREFRKYVEEMARGEGEGGGLEETKGEAKKPKLLLEAEEKRKGKELKHQERLKEFPLMRSGVMWKLKKDLKNIDERKDFSPEELKERKTVFYDEPTERLFIFDDSGIRKEITFGDLAGDYEWGIKYAPDVSVPPKIWRRIRKISAFYEARDEIEKISNKELFELYSLSLPTTALDLAFINANLKKENVNMSPILAERMMVSFLRRVQYNNLEVGLRVEKSNALEDIVLKYDFKLSAIKRQGIALEPNGQTREEFVSNKRKLGIQFTTGGGLAYREKKLKQIIEAIKKLPDYKSQLRKPVDDIVLVAIFELSKFGDCYKKWIADGEPSGGPEQYLSREQKLEIFKQATKGLVDLSEEELQKLKI